MERKEIITCYDADFIPFYVCHTKKDEQPKTLEECIVKCDEFIFNINMKLRADSYCGFITMGKCFRYDIKNDYKGNRKYDNLPEFINQIKQHLVDKHKFKYNNMYEADDMVMSYKKQNENEEKSVIIVSPDKDILNIVEIGFNPRAFDYVINHKNDLEYNFWEQMIIGDQIDNIKGIPKKGKVAVKEFMGAGKLKFNINIVRNNILNGYIKYYGEYEGIKEFSKNYLCLKIVDNVDLGEIELNKIEKTILL